MIESLLDLLSALLAVLETGVVWILRTLGTLVGWAVPDDDEGFFLGLGCFVGTVMFLVGWSQWRAARRIEDTPRSKVSSLALGCVHLEGRAVSDAPLTAPVSGRRCVYWDYEIDKESDDPDVEWESVASDWSAGETFYLEDETGRVLVDPTGAGLEIGFGRDFEGPPFRGRLRDVLQKQGIFPERGRKYRFTETVIAVGARIFVQGVAQGRQELEAGARACIVETLAAIEDEPQNRARYETDGDGLLTGAGRDAARRDAARMCVGDLKEDVVVARDALDACGGYLISRGTRASNLAESWAIARAGLRWGAPVALLCLGGILLRCGHIG